jgi:tartrate dehydratase beta subunit/fumarate hydratase class I family protein
METGTGRMSTFQDLVMQKLSSSMRVGEGGMSRLHVAVACRGCVSRLRVAAACRAVCRYFVSLRSWGSVMTVCRARGGFCICAQARFW